HVVEVTAPGRKAWRGTAQATAKATYALAIPVLEPDGGASQPSPRDRGRGWTGLHTSAVVATAVGGVGVIVGAVAGLSALAEGKAAGCANGFCPTPTALDSSRSAYQAGNVATAGFVVGGVALAGAAVLWIVAPARKPAQARWQGARPPVAASYGVDV